MAGISAIDFLCYRVMGDLLNIGVAVTAWYISMDAVVVHHLVNVIIMLYSVFVYSAQKPVFMAHHTVFRISGFCDTALNKQREQYK